MAAVTSVQSDQPMHRPEFSHLAAESHGNVWCKPTVKKGLGRAYKLISISIDNIATQSFSRVLDPGSDFNE